MKKILFVAAFATLLAAGCQKTEIINPTPGDALTFSTHMGKLTKASDAENPGEFNLYEQDFKVWAFKAYEDAVNGDKPGDVYDNITAIDVTSDNGTAWGTKTEYYWPGVNKELDFFAVSTGATWYEEGEEGETGETGETGVSVDIEGEGLAVGSRKLTVNNYVVDNTNPNDDLMVAEFVRQHQGMNEKNVKLHFKHALAKVQFKFYTTAKEEDKVSVNNLTVKDLKTSGSLLVTEAEKGYEDNTGRVEVKLAWTPAAVTATFTDDKDAPIELAPATEEGVAADPVEFATWLVLPQDITDKTVAINYTINGRTFDQVFALTREAVAGTDETPEKPAFKEWGINQVITYTINLTPNRITFKPSVEEWDPETPQTDVN